MHQYTTQRTHVYGGQQTTDTSHYTNTVTMGVSVAPSWCQCPVCTNRVHVLSYDAPAPVLLPPVEYRPQYNWRELLPYPRCNIVRNEGRGRHPPPLVRVTLSPRSSARRKSWKTIRRSKPTPSKKDYVNHGDAGSEPQYK